MSYYILTAKSNIDKYLSDFRHELEYYRQSKFHNISGNITEITIPDEDCFDENDFYYSDSIPIFSMEFYQSFSELIEKRYESYYVNPIDINYQGMIFKYIIVLPSKILCKDYNGNIINGRNGFLEMFKSVDSANIYLSEKLFEKMKQFNPSGTELNKIKIKE